MLILCSNNHITRNNYSTSKYYIQDIWIITSYLIYSLKGLKCSYFQIKETWQKKMFGLYAMPIILMSSSHIESVQRVPLTPTAITLLISSLTKICILFGKLNVTSDLRIDSRENTETIKKCWLSLKCLFITSHHMIWVFPYS